MDANCREISRHDAAPRRKATPVWETPPNAAFCERLSGLPNDASKELQTHTSMDPCGAKGTGRSCSHTVLVHPSRENVRLHELTDAGKD